MANTRIHRATDARTQLRLNEVCKWFAPFRLFRERNKNAQQIFNVINRAHAHDSVLFSISSCANIIWTHLIGVESNVFRRIWFNVVDSLFCLHLQMMQCFQLEQKQNKKLCNKVMSTHKFVFADTADETRAWIHVNRPILYTFSLAAAIKWAVIEEINTQMSTLYLP